MMQLFTIDAFIFLMIGIASMWSHAIKKWTMGEIRGKLVDWYCSHPRATVMALMTMVSGIATAVLSGTLTDYSVGSQVLAAWGIGYASDTINTQGGK